VGSLFIMKKEQPRNVVDRSPDLSTNVCIKEWARTRLKSDSGFEALTGSAPGRDPEFAGQ